MPKKKLELVFLSYGDTLNTLKFKELVEPGKKARFGIIYLQKDAAEPDLGDDNPASLVITITVGD